MAAAYDGRGRFRDVELEDISGELVTPLSPTRQPKWYRRGRSRDHDRSDKSSDLDFRTDSSSLAKRRKRRRRMNISYIVLAVVVFLGCMAALAYISFVDELLRRLAPPESESGLQAIAKSWKEPDSKGANKFQWRDDFSYGIVPKNCHSHNDYWRTAPLYDALAAGCVGIEADIWVMDDEELRVSHSWGSIQNDRTLRNMYLDPLANIFANRNVSTASVGNKEVGVFDTDPNASVVLLIDFKNDGHKTWPVLMKQLQPLHEKGWLTHFDGKNITRGPLTIVGTGNTPFELVQNSAEDRIIFFDAPLEDVSNPVYTQENSYYASIPMGRAIGRIWFNKLSSSQVDTIKTQIKAAADKGILSRYWDTPSWPISLRDKVWFTLSENDVGMLNVDDLVSATRWNWNWCVIAGLTLCGNS